MRCGPKGHTESDTTERQTCMHASKETKLRSAQHKAHSEAKEGDASKGLQTDFSPTLPPWGEGFALSE